MCPITAIIRQTQDDETRRKTMRQDAPGASALTPADRASPASSEIAHEDAKRARHYFKQAHADNTQRAYDAQLRKFIDYAEANDVEALPAFPATVASFLAAEAEQYTVATVRARAAGIAAAHRRSGYEDPTKHEAVRDVLKGIRREHGTKQKQAQGITDRTLVKIESVTSDTPRDLRDFALLLVARDLLARRSELTALNIDDIDVEDDDATAHIKRSKTDQDGIGAQGYISPQALNAIREYINACEITGGALFRGIYNDGSARYRLSERAIERAFKRLAKRAGIDASKISGHSARIGMAQDLAASGASTTDLQTAGRWSSPAMPARYTEKQNARRNPVARWHCTT